MKQFEFSKYCTPAQLYLVLAAISLLSAFLKDFSVITLLANAVFVVLFAWILNFLCKKGFKTISWVLVLLPFALFAAGFLLAMEADKVKDVVEGMEKKDKKDNKVEGMEKTALDTIAEAAQGVNAALNK